MKRTLLAVTLTALAVVPAAFGSDTGSSTLNLSVGAEASFLTTDANTNFSADNGKFASRTATTNFSYKVGRHRAAAAAPSRSRSQPSKPAARP